MSILRCHNIVGVTSLNATIWCVSFGLVLLSATLQGVAEEFGETSQDGYSQEHTEMARRLLEDVIANDAFVRSFTTENEEMKVLCVGGVSKEASDIARTLVARAQKDAISVKLVERYRLASEDGTQCNLGQILLGDVDEDFLEFRYRIRGLATGNGYQERTEKGTLNESAEFAAWKQGLHNQVCQKEARSLPFLFKLPMAPTPSNQLVADQAPKLACLSANGRLEVLGGLSSGFGIGLKD